MAASFSILIVDLNINVVILGGTGGMALGRGSQSNGGNGGELGNGGNGGVVLNAGVADGQNGANSGNGGNGGLTLGPGSEADDADVYNGGDAIGAGRKVSAATAS